ncbi:MAG: VOC family protein [Longimicrobiales bacterium]|nr:VOC family protein [Longimicrobiales bacterium]
MTPSPPAIDHLLIGAPDLDAGCDWVEARLGVRPEPGGSHARWGTRNAILSLGRACYLEVIAPAPALVPPPGGVLFGLDGFAAPRPVAWVLRVEDVAGTARRASRSGLDLGEVFTGERVRADGTRLSWTMSDPAAPRRGGSIPFLIDWGATPHPGATAPAAGSVHGIRIGHPDPETVRAHLHELAAPAEVEVEAAPTPRLAFEIATGDQTVRLVPAE